MPIKKIKPGPGQESVWDYPRPPKLEPFKGSIKIIFAGDVIAECQTAYRALETSHPPTYYLPPDAFKTGVLIAVERTSYCEFKGMAHYFDIAHKGRIAEYAAWSYPDPNKNFLPIQNYISVYAHLMEACYVNDEKVKAQEGGFYGGWVTDNIVGPFKGAPGTWGW
ncbi:MAG TPA: hypothetical protein DDY13_11670 [Cytophagales bacterium]|jgi:uncharacterized protein (DUF427 family)|nr:hypothetical protein [Cytophagales bacterium]